MITALQAALLGAGQVADVLVHIKSPQADSTVSGTIIVEATCTVSIASMQFWLDGQHLGAATTTKPYHVCPGK
jgi:type 1 fimbria pilin